MSNRMTQSVTKEFASDNFVSLAECQARIDRLNKRMRQLSSQTTIRSVSQIPALTPTELARLAVMIAGRQNRPVTNS